MVSFIIPAHNEEACLPATLHAIHVAAAETIGGEYEVIVVDDASTDATARVAREYGAMAVVSVNHRQIAATRNAGARAAAGDRLFFVDADTTVTPRAVAAALRQLDRGAAGGGAPVRFDGNVPLYANLLVWWFGWMMRFAGLTGGAFMFCTRAAFDATGGFDERLFAAEDAAMSWALKRHGPFVVLWDRVTTSGRRVRGWRGIRVIGSLIGIALFPGMLRERSRVKKVWYESDRRGDEHADGGDGGNPVLLRLCNLLVLLVLLAVVTSPLWMLVPWSLTPRGSAIGYIRLAVAVVTCHVAMVLWPCTLLLLRAIVRQTRWIERYRFAALTALCLWFAWTSTPVVIWFWKSLFTT